MEQLQELAEQIESNYNQAVQLYNSAIDNANESLMLVDENGTPHIYNIQEEPDYESEEILPDGNRNYYPEGSETEPVNPEDDELEILADGTYLVTKKDKTIYHYSHFGQLTKIEDTNGRYLNFTYNDHELVGITDTFDRQLTIERNNGKITKIIDLIGREYVYGYNGDRLASYTDPEGNSRRYTYDQNGITSTIYPDGSSWEYFYIEIDGQMVIDYQIDPAGFDNNMPWVIVNYINMMGQET